MIIKIKYYYKKLGNCFIYHKVPKIYEPGLIETGLLKLKIMSIASDLKYKYQELKISLNKICNDINENCIEKIVENKKENYTTLTILFNDSSILEITEKSGKLYFK